MSKRKRVETFGIMQYFDEDYWNWSDDEKKNLTDSKLTLLHILDRIREGMKQAGATQEEIQKVEFAGIEHDSDTFKSWDEVNEVYTIEQKKTHIHAVVKLPKRRDVSVVAQWVGVEEQYIEIPRGRYGRENMLAYLIHAKSPDKYLYNAEDVHTFGTFDYMEYWRGKKMNWDKHRATVQKKGHSVDIDFLVKQVQLGAITKEQILGNDDYSLVYADNMRDVNDAIQFYNEKTSYDTLEALENGDFELSVYFFTGKSNSGKTALANEIINDLIEMKGWRCHEASSKNPMDGYTGQEIILLDDFRARTLEAVQWLKMFDPKSKATLDARYNAKPKAYRAIMITSVHDMYTFFSNVSGVRSGSEPLDQFIRRIMNHVIVIDTGKEREVTIEAIGQTPYEITYNYESKNFLTKNEKQSKYINGVPIMSEENELTHDNYLEPKNYTQLRFAGIPVYQNQFDYAKEKIVNDILEMNNPDNDHSDTERPKINESHVFDNALIELSEADESMIGFAKALKLKYKNKDGVVFDYEE